MDEDDVMDKLNALDLSDDSDYETDEDEREAQKAREIEELKQENITVAKGFAEYAIRTLIDIERRDKYFTGADIMDYKGEKNTITVIDDKMIEGISNDLVYSLELDIVNCNYVFPDKAKGKPIESTINQCVGKLLQSINITLSEIEVPKDFNLIFEPQTMTLFTDYNSYHRIGICMKIMALKEYESRNEAPK